MSVNTVTVVLATKNPDKVAEIRRMLLLPGLHLLDLDDFPGAQAPEEDGATLRANALKKAQQAACHTGLPALADDTGLEVDALDGKPGLFSARLAGPGATYEDNRLALLELLDEAGESQRRATFRCVVALAEPDGWSDTVEGACRGRIVDQPRGGGDFGYDPLFLVPALGKTFAEMSPQEKDAVSHRGRAIRRAARLIATRYGLRR